MTIIFHLIGLIIRATRIVHRHDERAVERTTHHLLEEGLWRVFLSRALSLAILILKSIGELLNRCTDGECEHPIDLAQHLGLGFLNILRTLALCHHIAQLESKLTQFGGDDGSGLRCIVGRIRLWHHLCRHKPVFICQVGYTTESTTIVDRMMEEELHTLVVDGLLACIDDPLKHEVGLFKLIPEEEIGLRELYLHGVALGKVGAQHIEAAEHPAAP